MSSSAQGHGGLLSLLSQATSFAGKATSLLLASAASSLPKMTTLTASSLVSSCVPAPIATCTVVRGDNASDITAKHNISLGALRAANPGKALHWDVLPDGVELVIPGASCVLAELMPKTGFLGSQVNASVTWSTVTETSSSAPNVTPSPSVAPQPTVAPEPKLAPELTVAAPTTQQSLQLYSSTTASVWTVDSGDTGQQSTSGVAIPFAVISSANPTVNWTGNTVGQPMPVLPSPTALATVTGSIADKTFDKEAGGTIPQAMYTEYDGDGSAADRWPKMSDWLSFQAQISNLQTVIGQNCPDGVPSNSQAETTQLVNSILTVGAGTFLDPRWILATVMQESNGCVRVKTNLLNNPKTGVLQSYYGRTSCNHNGTLEIPCPAATIQQMIMNGAVAAVDGITLVSALNLATGMFDFEPGQAFYRASRLYNSGPGSLTPAMNGDLGRALDGASRCYSSDIANRLIGWTNGNGGRSPCTLDDKLI